MKDLFDEVEVLVRGNSLRERDLHRGLNLDLSRKQPLTDTMQLELMEPPPHTNGPRDLELGRHAPDPHK